MIPRAIMGVLLLVLAGAPSLVCAQDETKPKRPPPRPPVQAAAVPVVKPAPKPVATLFALPAPLATGAAFTGGGLASGGFANGGLRSNLPVVVDAAPACRATCAKTRYVCLATDDATECDPRWTQCVATCR